MRAPSDDFPRDVYRARRAAFCRATSEESTLFFAGRRVGRNYAANKLPYRASSHFLHFVGFPVEGAILLLERSSEPTLHVRDVPAGDDVWHGPSPSHDALTALLGIRVRPIGDLSPEAAGEAAYLPSFEASTVLEQHATAGPARDRERLERLADTMISLRLRHDQHALAELTRASRVTELAHSAGMGITRPGRTTAEVRAMMEAIITAHGMTPAYGSIVTARGEVLHSEGDDDLLTHRDYILADVGAESHFGYAADVTRTYPASGRFDPLGRELYEAVLRVQRSTIDLVRVGARYLAIHASASLGLAQELVALGLLRGDPAERAVDGSIALFFPHGVGHLVGLDVHDMEDLGDRAGYAPGRTRSTDPSVRFLRLDRDLEADMVVTVEPGIYFIPSLIDDGETRAAYAGRVAWDTVDTYRHVRGIRIEDDVHVREQGPNVLTSRAPKRVFGLEETVGAGIDWDRLMVRTAL